MVPFYLPNLPNLYLFGVGGGGSPPVIQPWRTIVTQNRINSGQEARTGKDRQVFRWPYRIATDCTELVLSVDGWIMGSGSELVLPNAYTIESLSLEANGVVSPVLYSGGRSKTINPADVDVKSDVLLPSTFGLTYFPKGMYIWAKGIAGVPATGQMLPYTSTVTNAAVLTGTQLAWFSSTLNTVSSTDVTGLYTISGGSFDARLNGVRPRIWGRPVDDSTYRTLVTVGDSIADYQNDNGSDLTTDATKISGTGFALRSCRTADGSDFIGSLNLARAGTPCSAYSGSVYTKQLYKYGKFFLDESGTNTLSLTANALGLSTMQSHKAIIKADALAAGCTKVGWTELWPRVDSSNTWSNAAGQTYRTGWGPGEFSEQWNTYAAAELVAGNIDFLITLGSIRDPIEPLKFLTNGSPQYVNQDNTHPNFRGHEFIAADPASGRAIIMNL